MDDSTQSAHVLGRRSFRLAVVVGGATIAVATAAGVVLAAHFVARPAHPAPAAPAVARAAPSAVEVARDLAGVTTLARGERISQVSCLEGKPGLYVCSYARPEADACAVAMLKWTPEGSSTFTVQASGKVLLAAEECGPVKKVLHVLGTSG